MCGLLVGTVSLFLLARTLRRWAWGGHGGCGGGGWGHGHHRHGGWRRHGRGGWGMGGWGMGPMLHGIFSRLETTPGQERVIERELDSLRTVMDGVRQELAQSRSQLADLLRQEDLAGPTLEEAVNKQAAAVQKAHQALRDAFQTVHGALDPRQRSQLADMLEGRFQRGRRGGQDWEI